MTCPTPERVNILGVGVSALDLPGAVEVIRCWVREGRREYVVVCPVYTLMRSAEDEHLRAVTNGAGMVTPDGMPVVLVSRWMGHPQVDRVYGPDLLLAVAAASLEPGHRIRHYFYGGAEGVAAALADVLRTRFPGLEVVGAYAPPFRPLTPEEDAADAARINAAEPDIVWVGLGSPKQDEWMAAHRQRLNAPVLIGVGAAFDFLTGRTPQAPRWMQRLALEWLFRLMTEPRRLWKRYAVYNPRFMWGVTLQMTGIRHPPPLPGDAPR